MNFLKKKLGLNKGVSKLSLDTKSHSSAAVLDLRSDASDDDEDDLPSPTRKSRTLHNSRGSDKDSKKKTLSGQALIESLRNHLATTDEEIDVESFNLLATLGTGTFGRVRLVNYDYKGQKTYWALKMMKKTEIIKLKQVDHVKAEKFILNSISHPYIVNLLTSWQDPGSIYMLLEYVPGGELFTLLRNCGRFDNDTAIFYASEITLAFGYLHSQDVVYRDLKPENLLINKDGHIKITDFGFAKIVTERTWTLCGTPEYLAPEIIQSKGHGKAVDWWALGILIFEMLAGYPPFYDENPFAIYKKILAGDVQYPSHMKKTAQTLIGRLLTNDRANRLGSLNSGQEVQEMEWFASVNWESAFAGTIKPPIVMPFKSDDDTSNFDHYPDSTEPTKPVNAGDNTKYFKDF